MALASNLAPTRHLRSTSNLSGVAADLRQKRRIDGMYSTILTMPSQLPAFKVWSSSLVSECAKLRELLAISDDFEGIEDLFQRLVDFAAKWLYHDLRHDFTDVILHMSREMWDFDVRVKEARARFVRSSVSTPPRQEQFSWHDEDWAAVEAVLNELLKDVPWYESCLSLRGDDAERMMIVMQRYLDFTGCSQMARCQAFKILSTLCKEVQKFVSIPIIPIPRTGFQTMTRGGHGSIAQTRLFDGRLVAVKSSLKDALAADSKGPHAKILRMEVLVCRQLSHRNIMPLLGITQSRFGDVGIVMPWQANGDLARYMKLGETGQINRLRILWQICSAVQYLHEHQPSVIHGDLKCSNVLIDGDGTPRLSDLGMSTVKYDGLTETSVLEGGSLPWQAPELHMAKDEAMAQPTASSDIWALGMLGWELLTERIPYDHHATPLAARYAIIGGERPPLSDWASVQRGLNTDVYRLLRKLWELEPADRPSAREVLPELASLSAKWLATKPRDRQHRRRTTGSLVFENEEQGKLIGLDGAPIVRCEKDLDVRISVMDRQILIEGPAENVAEARARLRELARGDADIERRVRIHKHQRDKLLSGDGSDLRKHLRHKFSVTITVPSAGEYVLVRGRSKSALAAEQEIVEALEQQHSQVTVEIPAKCRPRLLVQLSDLQKSTNTAIELAQQSDGSIKVVISGRKSATQESAALIRRMDREVRSAERLVDVSKPALQRLCNSIRIRRIKESCRLEELIISPADAAHGSGVLVSATSDEYADKAERMLAEVERDIAREVERFIAIPEHQQRWIFGFDNKSWSDMVAQCGGPRDASLQREILTKVTSAGLYLQGPPSLLDSLQQNINDVIRRQTCNVYGTSIHVQFHAEIQERLLCGYDLEGAVVVFPSDEAYDKCDSPVNYSGKSPKSVVKIIGTSSSYKKARSVLLTIVHDLESRLRIVVVPAKYQAAIYAIAKADLRGCSVDISLPSGEQLCYGDVMTPISGCSIPQTGYEWEVTERYDKGNEQNVEWILRGDTASSLDLAEKIVSDAWTCARESRKLGRLALAPSLHVPARFTTILANIAQKTRTSIDTSTFGDGESAIFSITGSTKRIVEARDGIVHALGLQKDSTRGSTRT